MYVPITYYYSAIPGIVLFWSNFKTYFGKKQTPHGSAPLLQTKEKPRETENAKKKEDDDRKYKGRRHQVQRSEGKWTEVHVSN